MRSLRNLIIIACGIIVFIFVYKQIVLVKESLQLSFGKDATYKADESLKSTSNLQTTPINLTEPNDAEHLSNFDDSGNKIDYDGNCEETFNSTLQDNVDVLRNYPRGVAGDYMWKLGDRFRSPLKNEPYPVILMALDRHHYRLSQGLFKSFHFYILSNTQYKGDIKVIVYDIGLTRRQKKIMQSEGCRCEIRVFPFEEFPSHMKNRNLQAWKPIIIQLVLIEYGKVLWVDASIRFNSIYLNDLLAASKKYGIVYRTDPTSKLIRNTHTDLFKYLGEDQCKFQSFDMIKTDSLALFYTTESRAVLTAWVWCALNIDCIAPASTRTQNTEVCNSNSGPDGACHHFEQSVLGILARRIYHKQQTDVFNNVLGDILYSNKTDDSVAYFEQCGRLQCYM